MRFYLVIDKRTQKQYIFFSYTTMMDFVTSEGKEHFFVTDEGEYYA